MLEDLIHDILYVSNKTDRLDVIDKISSYLQTSKHVLDDIRLIVSSRNNENYYAYDEIILKLLLECDKDTKILVITNFSQYEDLIKDNSIYISLWNSLSCKEKIEYLEGKKKYSSLDILLINETLKDGNSFKENDFLNAIFNNEMILKKIDADSIVLKTSMDVLSLINLNDMDKCIKLTKETITSLLLKKCKTFNEFVSLYNDNKKIFKLLAPNGLVFGNEDNEEIYKFILENPQFIGKFNQKYLDLFNIMEITKLSKTKEMDADSYKTVVTQLYKYNKDKANDYFNEESLRRCPKHSIDVYPFNDLSSKNCKKIFDDYTLFNRFIDTIMIEAISNNFLEEDIVNILRNDTFIEDMSSYGIELLINKLSFKAAFNMLQRKVIFNKISHLNIKVAKTDMIFFKGFLDSPILVYKSEHNMIYDMLSLMNSNDISYYVTLPYIMNNLSNYEMINLIINANLSIKEILSNDEIYDKFNLADIISLIDKCNGEIDLEIFKDKRLSRDLFNLSDKEIDRINFDEVNYLYETIRMKSILSKQDASFSVIRYKCVLTSYLVLGLNETLRMVEDGNKNVTLGQVLKLKEDVVNEKMLLFKGNNSAVFQNMAKKLTSQLMSIQDDVSLVTFCDYLRQNTYLDNIIYLMLDNGFDSYNGIIERLYSFYKCLKEDELTTKKDIYEYTKKFIDLYLYNKMTEYNSDFNRVILKNFKVKEDIVYRKRKELGCIFIDKLRFKLFVRTLMDSKKEAYGGYFIDDFDVLKIKDKYLEELECKTVDYDSILEHVLIPLMNGRFDRENCLNKLGIVKPPYTDEYFLYETDRKNIGKLNKLIKKLKKIPMNDKDIISIMEYITYGKDLPYDVTKKEQNKLNKLISIRNSISRELYIDRENIVFTSNQVMDIYNVAEIKHYNKYLKILDEIVKKTNRFVSSYTDKEKIKNVFARDYYKAMNTDDCVFPITKKYYEPEKRVLSLKDIETIFSGYNLSNWHVLDDELKKFLFKRNNLVMVVDGYYDDLIDNLGIIIDKWDRIYDYIKNENKDISSISLISMENILSVINFNDNRLCKSLNKKIINELCEDGVYVVHDLNKRIGMLESLYKNSFRRINSTIPYLCYSDDVYRIEILDSYNEDILRGLGDTIYKVGAIGNDFLHYSILNKNGVQIGIYRDNELIGKILGVRNGNTVYLNSEIGEKDENVNRLLGLFANELVRITNDDKEPIEFVTIVNNDIYTSENGLRIDTTMCPVINDPISKLYYDYESFISNDNLLGDGEIVANYEDNVSTLLASSAIVDKNNFRYYDAEDKYYRRRNSVIKLSNNIGEDYLNRIDTLLYLCKMEDESLNIEDITLSNINTIYLGDDFVVFVYDNTVLKYVLPYDGRAMKEIDIIMEGIGFC